MKMKTKNNEMEADEIDEMEKIGQSKGRPKDLSALWMDNRIAMIGDETTAKQFAHLLISIEMGTAMLSAKQHDDLQIGRASCRERV